MQKTLGGDRIGSGSKMKLALHNYHRSTHDMGYIWRSTMAAGTLVPFLVELALPGDSFDIKLDANILTHPTYGPLFGSFKAQFDIYTAPLRLYNGLLHNNTLDIGNNMKQVTLPTINLRALPSTLVTADIDNAQVNPSSILSYLGIRGMGFNTDTVSHTRVFNAVPFIMYWDIYKNYYSNKQEGIGAVIHTQDTSLSTAATTLAVTKSDGASATIPKAPTAPTVTTLGPNSYFTVTQAAGAAQNLNHIKVITSFGYRTLAELGTTVTYTPNQTATTSIRIDFNYSRWGVINVTQWTFVAATDIITSPPVVSTFPLSNLDGMRDFLTRTPVLNTPLTINNYNNPPYSYIFQAVTPLNNFQYTQEGLALKTYQSDLFNNWLNKSWYDSVTTRSSVDTSTGAFSIDTLNIAQKVYNLLNRIMVSGGTYDDWIDAVYTNERYTQCYTPVYHGGLSKELVFQEVVSNSAAPSTDGNQPLGTLAGRGVLSNKHKGGYIHIRVDEPSYIMGIVSLTPRLDYSQGNKWDTRLATMDDLHKPALDQIGFQDLITEQMAWWSTNWDIPTSDWKTYSAGKQPAWINYMTNVNQTRGNFAIPNNEMFMTLNRKYEIGTANNQIKDLTTYIDPSKYNTVFAQKNIDAQNFWTQIAVDITARRKMSAKVMPNL